MTQGAVKTPGKRSQAVSAKKQAILGAALDTFSQFGIHGTRLEQVAERAGVSKTNLLYYYPSKEVLYVAVLQQILDIWLAPLKAFREEFTRWWRLKSTSASSWRYPATTRRRLACSALRCCRARRC
jgi:TetR/AcrR family transcriptional regulator